MALIPGVMINGKFKPYYQMTTEELKQVVIKSQIKKTIVLLFTTVFVSLALVLLIF